MQTIQSKGTELPSLYDETQFEKAGFRINKTALAVTLFLFLLIARFLNLGLWWLVTCGELSSRPVTSGVQYTFLNFSSAAAAAKKIAEMRAQVQKTIAKKPILVAGYFNVLHPAVFLVHNNTANTAPIDLGQVIVMAPPGLSSYSVSLAGRVSFTQGAKTGFADFDHSLLLKFTGLSKPAEGTVSITMKSPEKTAAIYIPYLVYFLLPLIAVLVLVNFFSPALLGAYFYFPLMFLLFDFQILFSRVPFSWLIGVPEKHGFSNPETWISLVLVGLFIAAAVFGLSMLKRRRDVYKETLMVWFFPLLPLFLRF